MSDDLLRKNLNPEEGNSGVFRILPKGIFASVLLTHTRVSIDEIDEMWNELISYFKIHHIGIIDARGEFSEDDMST